MKKMKASDARSACKRMMRTANMHEFRIREKVMTMVWIRCG